MAQIDPSIAMSIRPAQIESPLVHAARAAELQGAQQTQFMNMLKMKEYGDESRTKNAMKKWLSDKPDLDDDKNINYLATQFGMQGLELAKQIDDRRKARGEAAHRAEQIEDLKSQRAKRGYELGESQTKNAINTISGLANRQQALNLLYQSEANGTIPPEAAESIRSMIPYDDEKFPAFKQSLIERLASPDERMRQSNRQQDRDAPMWELRKIGDREVPVDVNPYSKTVGQIKPGAEALVDDTPKWTARDIGGSIVYVDENPFSKTSGQQKANATLTKTAAPAPVTESALTRLERELAEAVKTHGANSSQAKNIRNKIEQETGGLERQRIGIDRQRLNLERYKASKGDGSGRGPGPGTKLEKGEVWNEAEQRIETVPGSKLNIAQSNAHGKDRSSLVAVETKTNSAINKIDEILDPENQAGFDANFSGMVPYGGFVTGRFAPDTRRSIESLKADMKSAGLDLIRQGGSIGQITEREWPILEAMIAGISPEMTPDAARKEFIKVRAYMNRLKDNARDAYETEWGDTQYFKPAPGDKTPRPMSAQDKQALNWATANPKDPRSAQIKQRLGVK
jgi:hypothetical protein